MTQVKQAISRRGFLMGAGVLGIAASAGAIMGGCTADQGLAETGEEASERAGVGEANGKNGIVKVRASFAGEELVGLDVVESIETAGVGEAAQDVLRDLILANQSLNVDTISGATITSMAYLAAVKGAFDDAGQSASEWAKREMVAPERDEEIPEAADIVIIGSGGAGLAAAITAAKAKKSVVVLEKLGTVGGNSALSGAGYAAPGTWLQRQKGIEDSPALMAEDMLKGGDNLGDPVLVQTLCEGALDAQEWLTYEGGVAWQSVCAPDGGHSVGRTIQPIGYGAAVMVKLAARARKLGVRIACDATADEIIMEGGAAAGVAYTDGRTGESRAVKAPKVIIASGGFGANLEMRTQYVPELTDEYGCTDAPGTTGDGILMGQAVGAGITGMEYIQTHPTGSTTTGNMLSMGSIRSKGFAFMVNKQGKRFVNELGRRDVVCNAELQQEDGCGYFVFSRDQGMESGIYDRAADELGGMRGDGTYFEADTLEEVCEHFGVDAAGVQASIEKWNADAASGEDTEYGYTGEMVPFGEAPYAMFSVTPIVHYTMGGLTINEKAEVLSEDGSIIPGLYAAGEVTGGIMGSNRLGTTSYVDIIVYGRIAGANAAA